MQSYSILQYNLTLLNLTNRGCPQNFTFLNYCSKLKTIVQPASVYSTSSEFANTCHKFLFLYFNAGLVFQRSRTRPKSDDTKSCFACYPLQIKRRNLICMKLQRKSAAVVSKSSKHTLEN